MVTLLRVGPLERLRQRALALATSEGQASFRGPDLCVFRFSTPTSVVKAPSFGLTLGAVVQGSKTVRVHGQAFVVDPHRLFVVTRDVDLEMAVTHGTAERPYVGISLCFAPEQVARALTSLAAVRPDGDGPEPSETVPAFAMPVDEELADALARLLRTFDDPVERTLLSPLVTDEILYRLLRSDAAAAVRHAVGRAADASRIVEAMQYIRGHYQDKLSVDELARRTAMSPSHFAHRFTAVARISPMRYLREVRLERARHLLFESGARAGDVGVQVGFDSAAHFAREFKRRFGTPPSQFIRRQA